MYITKSILFTFRNLVFAFQTYTYSADFFSVCMWCFWIPAYEIKIKCNFYVLCYFTDLKPKKNKTSPFYKLKLILKRALCQRSQLFPHVWLEISSSDHFSPTLIGWMRGFRFHVYKWWTAIHVHQGVYI